ncbi:hypothetical protein NHF46_20415 [Arthrobacter alpinus]|nr:hypothetical protein [Arthrobacter alpinus]
MVAPTTPALTLDTATAEAGSTVKVSLTGFAPDQEVTVELHSTPVQLTKVTTGTDGTAEATVTIPSLTVKGEHSIVATQGELSATATLTVTVVEPTATATPTADPSTVPTTGPTPTADPTSDPTTGPTTSPTQSASPSTSASATPSASSSATTAAAPDPAASTPASKAPTSTDSSGAGDLAKTGSTSKAAIGLALLSLLAGLGTLMLLRRRGKRA